jgi:arylsulfatase A-like enzyme
MTAAARRLAELRAPFFLQVESFDVHEPFHVPEPYRALFGDPADDDRFTLWPPYQDPRALAKFMAATSPEELAFVRARYLAKVAMVDRWLGDLLDVVDWDETAVILTTDHGHDLGARGVFGKQYPHWDSHARIPLLVWHPAHPEGGVVDALTSTVDLFSTIADLAGAEADARHGHSLVPLLSGGEGHDALLYGTFGQGVCCTDGEWTVFKSPTGEGPLYSYTSLLAESLVVRGLAEPAGADRYLPDVEFPQWRIPVEKAPLSREDFLFHRPSDPGQERNLWDDEPEQRDRMLGLLRELIEREGAPAEQWERLGL